MKTLLKLFLVTNLFFVLTGCEKLTSLFEKEKDDPNSIGGTTSVPLNQPGNTINVGYINVGGKDYDMKESIKVIKNDNGLTTFEVKAEIPKGTVIEDLIKKIPVNIKDASGNINTSFNLKITSEGIQDFFNKDNKAHTLVKYDANVGDTYKITKSDGKTITRTVTQKSTTDDFPYGFLNIKTITVEQDSRVPGIKKFVFKANHKFGLVYAEIHMEDGSKLSSYLYSDKY
ncbi:MAG: hypothetical protein N2321_00175 [Melioribacteraceae bacterium]|nr:hypothetical protein [Melioribacteraceae bacterium]